MPHTGVLISDCLPDDACCRCGTHHLIASGLDHCYSQFMGLTVGYMSIGGVESAISARGWFERVKRR